MHFFKNRYAPWLLLLVLSIPLFFLCIYPVHSWGDDFAQYIKEAQNIAAGKPYYLSNYIYNSHSSIYAPPQYPPGFPLLLVPVVKFWGISYTAFCYFNSIIASAFLFVLFRFFRNYMGVVSAICLAIIISYSGFMIDLKRSVLSDVSCCLFTTLFFIVRQHAAFSWQRLLVMILLVVAVVQIRSQAIFILAAEGIYWLGFVLFSLIKERRFSLRSVISGPSLPLIAGVLLLNFFLNNVVFPTPVSTGSFYSSFITATLHGDLKYAIISSLSYLLTAISSFFHYNTYNGFTNAATTFIESAGLTFSVIGFIIKFSKRPEVGDVFFVIMCFVILFFPGHDPRYFLPAIPFLFLYCFFAFRAIAPIVTKLDSRVLAGVITVFYLSVGFSFLKKSAKEIPPGCIPEQREFVAFDYISKHVKDNEIIAFAKPRLLTLYTNKKSINIAWYVAQETNKKVFDSLNVKYMLVLDGLEDGFFKDYMQTTQRPIDSLHIAPGYTLYSLR